MAPSLYYIYVWLVVVTQPALANGCTLSDTNPTGPWHTPYLTYTSPDISLPKCPHCSAAQKWLLAFPAHHCAQLPHICGNKGIGFTRSVPTCLPDVLFSSYTGKNLHPYCLARILYTGKNLHPCYLARIQVKICTLLCLFEIAAGIHALALASKYTLHANKAKSWHCLVLYNKR